MQVSNSHSRTTKKALYERTSRAVSGTRTRDPWLGKLNKGIFTDFEHFVKHA